MRSAPDHWADSDVAEPLKRMLESAELADSDDGALERVCSRLEHALGHAFDARPAEAATWQISFAQLRGLVAAGVVTAAAVGVTLWCMSLRVLPQPVISEVVPPEPPPTAASVSAVEPVPPTTPREPEPTRAAQPRRHQSHATQPGLAEELAGLAQIRALLKASPERALAAAAEQQKRFAQGALTPERQLLRLDALMRLGRATQAKTLAAQLTAATENHPYKARIAELLTHHH